MLAGGNMTNDEIIDLTKMDPDEICHIKCHQRKSLMVENKKLRECVEYYASRGSSLVNERARECLRELDDNRGSGES